MKIRSLKVVLLRCTVAALNRRGFRNSEIATRCSIGVEAIARLMGMGLRPSPAECDRIEAFAVAELPALRPKPRKPISERVRIRRGKRQLVAYAGWDGPQRPPGGLQGAVAPPA